MSSQAVGNASRTSIKVNNYTAHEKHIQQILAVTFASTSVILALVAFYCFARMKKNLRHHLIMLLIASDLFKAIWYFIPAVMFLAGHPITNAFCQADGFLVSMGLEASDFVILLIAIHTALSVLRPGKITQESGLFPFRYQAHVCWGLFSILLPGLAFVNANNNGYISQGTFCYLPVRPIWYRLALSWVPRYIILLTILAIYLAIYIYTKSKFGDFDTDFKSSSTNSADHSADHSADRSAPSSSAGGPRSQRGTSVKTSPTSDRSPIRDIPIQKEADFKRPTITHRPSWFKYSFSRSDPVRLVTFDGELPKPKSNPNCNSTTVSPKQRIPRDPFADTVFRTPTLIEALRDRSLSALAMNRKPKDPNLTLRKRHKAIQRQLRFMFVYPMVYLVMWFPPFVNHCHFYTKKHNPPFALNCFSLCFLLLQCAVDCLIFCTREKPWRHTPVQGARKRSTEVVQAGNNIQMTYVSNGAEENTAVQVQGAGSNDLRSQLSSSPRRERFWWDEEGV